MVSKETVDQGGREQVCQAHSRKEELYAGIDHWDLGRLSRREGCLHHSLILPQHSVLLKYSVPSKTEKCQEKSKEK